MLKKIEAENLMSAYDRACEDANRCRTARDMANRAEQVAQQGGRPVIGNAPAAYDAYNRARAAKAEIRARIIAAMTGAA